MKNIEKVIIIGGGPSGLAAAIYTARAGLNPLVIAGSPPGGQLTLTSDVENYPGFESILGPELILKMRKHALKFKTRFIDDNVIKVNFSKKPFEISTYNKSFQSKTILITTGAKALWLGLASETRLRGKGVSACATCDGFFFRGKTVAVIGGGDTAMEEALTLAHVCAKVYLVHRRETFRASKIMIDRVINNPKIEIIYNAVVDKIIGEKKVEAIRLNQLNRFNQLKVDGVFIAIGHKPDTDLFKGHIELDKKGYILTSNRVALENLKISKFNYNFPSATSVSGVFAAGDCVDYLYRQAATAVGMGVAAALEIEKFIQNI